MKAMTNLSVEEGNKLIGEFMGGVYPYDYDPEYIRFYPITFGDMAGGYGCRIAALCFHSSWAWLMPVYIKIVKEELYGENEEATILFNIMYERLADGDGIEEVWNYIVQFILWYNSQTIKQ